MVCIQDALGKNTDKNILKKYILKIFYIKFNGQISYKSS